MFNAPQPRSRLYTSTDAYIKGAVATLFGLRYDGEGINRFEQALEEMAPGIQVVAVPMARVGIYLALKHLIRKGQKVILSPYTISDVVNMVLCAGGIPVFADIEESGSCNVDADIILKLLETEVDVGAVLVTHFYGLVCNITPIITKCRERGLPVIEDAAQAFGAVHQGRLAGSIGDVGIFSFGLLKNVTGFLGGAVLTKDVALASSIRASLQHFAMPSRKVLLKKMFAGLKFDFATLPTIFDSGVYWLFRYAYLHGLEFFKNTLDTDSNPASYDSFPERYSWRMSSAQAEIIIPQFSRFKAHTLERIAKAQIYHTGLADLPGLVLPPLRNDGSHIYYHYPLQCEDRDRLTRFMTARLRDVQISHHRNCASLQCFDAFHRECPNAEKAAQRVIYLPTYPGYRDDQAVANVEVIRAYLRESSAWV
jgi:perosamine synthetase